MIPHNKPTLGREEEEAACRAIRSGWVAQGVETESFEREFCAYLGLPEGCAVALSSGTAALYLALHALESKGKKVAFPVYACSALRHATAMAGAEEILVDIASGTPNADVTAVTDRGTDVAIIPHMFGIPVRLPQPGRTVVIEDCAQALGASVNGKKVGLAGKAAIFSFYATKLITTGGQGGMFVSTDAALADAVRDYRQFDQRRDRRHRFNFQLTDVQAAIGRAQLKKLPSFLARREEIFNRYRSTGLAFLDSSGPGVEHVTAARYRAVALSTAPRALIKSLLACGIKAIVPVEDWELLGDPARFPEAASLSRRTVSLPIYPHLTDKDIDAVIAAVKHS